MAEAVDSAARNVVVFLRDNAQRSLTPPRLDYDQAFQAHGFATRFVPVLATTTSPTPSSLKVLLSSREHDFRGLIVTSARGVAAFVAAAKDSGPTQDAWLPKPIWVVGNATAGAARKIGFTDIRGESSGDAERLADVIIADADAARSISDVQTPSATEISRGRCGWLFLAGDKARDMLPSKLHAAGVCFEKHEAYATSGSLTFAADLAACFAALPRVTAGLPPPVWVVFFSPSGVDLALPELKNQQERSGRALRWSSIGPATSARLVELGEQVAAEARKPCAEEMLAAILHATATDVPL
ncbi:hypothetical protein HDU87_002726 [Geranomyces variabilis]|uniref:Tetrapyrrole biosynthesis uroporphyrinogen III synthase domain-containing protein n=1 Tax=Geranomyces variabilis TaxID=109894 RepID=A0AAD5TS36_9FUNG|nr:hypothetical protein HDU87_002726 [Geranomyces variabilis]